MQISILNFQEGKFSMHREGRRKMVVNREWIKGNKREKKQVRDKG
jgi:hypothetical protein